MFAFQVTAVGKLKFKVSQRRDRRRSEIRSVFMGMLLNKHQFLPQAGFEKILIQAEF
jgi:hypothetical protein